MKKNTFLLIPILSLLFLISCKKESETMKGKLVIGFEVSSFLPCNDTIDYWVDDSSNQLDSLYAQITRGKKPYTEVYCEIEAEKRPKFNEGFPADYAGVLKVKKVLKVEAMTDQCE